MTNRIKRAWLFAACAAAAVGCTAGDPETQVLTGKIQTSGALAVRAVTGDTVITAATVRSDGSFTLSLPVGQRYRLEVLTTSGVRHVVAAKNGTLTALSFKVCDPIGPFDVGGIGPDGTSGGGTGGGDGTCDPMDPDCKPSPCAPGDPSCGTWPCMDPSDPSCEPPPPCLPGDPSCEPPSPCGPNDPMCEPPPPCLPGDPSCEPPPPCLPGDPSCSPPMLRPARTRTAIRARSAPWIRAAGASPATRPASRRRRPRAWTRRIRTACATRTASARRRPARPAIPCARRHPRLRVPIRWTRTRARIRAWRILLSVAARAWSRTAGRRRSRPTVRTACVIPMVGG